MLTKRAGEFVCKCDVCGRAETFHADTHAEAWVELKSKAWAVRRQAYPIIHICPECPVEVSRERAN